MVSYSDTPAREAGCVVFLKISIATGKTRSPADIANVYSASLRGHFTRTHVFLDMFVADGSAAPTIGASFAMKEWRGLFAAIWVRHVQHLRFSHTILSAVVCFYKKTRSKGNLIHIHLLHCTRQRLPGYGRS